MVLHVERMDESSHIQDESTHILKNVDVTSTQMYKILSVYGVAVLLIIHFLKTVDGIFLNRAYALTNDEVVETPCTRTAHKRSPMHH